VTELTNEERLRRRAVRRVRAKLGFRNHLLVFVLVNAGLAAINLITSPRYLWFLYAMGGWGIGLLVHGLTVHGRTSGLREDMIAKELERLRAEEAARR
jgi:hypothetical protein